jgi:cytochrome bd-type quinol oxidase subunit 2
MSIRIFYNLLCENVRHYPQLIDILKQIKIKDSISSRDMLKLIATVATMSRL